MHSTSDALCAADIKDKALKQNNFEEWALLVAVLHILTSIDYEVSKTVLKFSEIFRCKQGFQTVP